MAQGTSTAPARGGWGEGIARMLQGGLGGLVERRLREQREERQGAAQDTIAKALMGEQIEPQTGEISMGGDVTAQPIGRTPNNISQMAQILAGNPDTAGMGFDMRMQDMARQQQLAAQQAAEERAFQRRKELAAMPKPGLSPEAFEQQRRLTTEKQKTAYGKTPVYVEMPDGSISIMQLSSGGGGHMVEGLPPGAKIIKPATVVGGQMVDPLSTETRRDVTGAIASGETAKVEGEATGDARARLPKVELQGENMLNTIEQIRNHPGRTHGAQTYIPAIRGTPRYAFERLVAQSTGQAFLQAFESIKGGGHITEIEGKKATEAITRLETVGLSKKEYDKALNDLQEVVERGLENARRRANRDAGTSPNSASEVDDLIEKYRSR